VRQSELPPWVWDILIELENQRDTHPKLLFQSATMDEPAKYDWCSCALLDLVPPDVLEHARTIRDYVQAKERAAATRATGSA
jgi:hypothetical protein